MAEKAPQTYKTLKWVIGSLLFISMVLVGAAWYLSAQLRPLLKNEIKELVLKSTSGLYRVDFSDIHTNLITGSATIDNVSIVPDTAIFNTLIKSKRAPNNLYYIKLKQISVKKIHPFAAYFDRKIDVGLLLFDKPEIRMVNKRFDFNDNRPPRPRKSPYDYISKLFKSLRVEVIDFRNAKFKYVNNNGPTATVDSVANLSIKLSDWLIDSLSAQDTSRMYLLKDIDVYCNNYSYATPDSMYHIQMSQLDFKASTGKLSIKQFGLMPRYREEDFAKANGYARDRFSILINNIDLEGINLPAYVLKREVIADKMNISDGIVSVYNNNTFPKLVKDKTGRFPHQLLQKLDFQTTIKRINVNNVDISYAEFDRTSLQKGKISFQHTTGTVKNVTNNPKIKAENHIMKADLTSYVMGQGKLDIHFGFDLTSPVGAYSYNGAIGAMDGRKFNQVVKPLGMIQINKGLIRELAFDIKADESVARGKVDFRFNDLSVTLLKKEEGSARLKKKGLLSILANALILYSDNPSADGKLSIATINYKRQPTSSFFSFVWKTLFQGIKHSIGITSQKEAEIRAKITEFHQMRDDREERRYRRELRKKSKERR